MLCVVQQNKQVVHFDGKQFSKQIKLENFRPHTLTVFYTTSSLFALNFNLISEHEGAFGAQALNEGLVFFKKKTELKCCSYINEFT